LLLYFYFYFNERFEYLTNMAQRFWTLSANVCQIEISETFVCLVSILSITPAILFDALRWANTIGSDTDLFDGNSVSINNLLVFFVFAI